MAPAGCRFVAQAPGFISGGFFFTYRSSSFMTFSKMSRSSGGMGWVE